VSRLWPETLALHIGADRLVLRTAEGRPIHLDGAPETCLRQLATQPASSRRALWRPRLRVTVADTLARYWLLEPPANAGSLATLQAIAAARFKQLYGEASEHWQIQADWQSQGSFLASALPASLAQAVRELAFKQHWQLTSLQPALVQHWNQQASQLPASLWFCSVTEHTLCYALLHQGHWLAVRQLRLAEPPSQAALLALLDGEARRLQVQHGELPQAVYWAGTASWLPQGARLGDWQLKRLTAPHSKLATELAGSTA